MDLKAKRARDIQEQIGKVLLQDWNPIGISKVEEAQDEYDSYIGKVYRVLSTSRSVEDVIDVLTNIESEEMGFSFNELRRQELKQVALKLLELDVSIS